MSIGKISVRYAKALFEAALSSNKSEAVYQDVKLLLETCSIPEFSFMLETPVAKPSQKKAVFESLFKGKVDKLTIDFLSLLAENKRESHIKDISRSYLTLHRNANNIKPVRLVTSSETDVEQVKEIAAIVEQNLKSKVELTTQVNKEIIGGFILQIENTQYDASISSKLAEIKRSLLETEVHQK